ncbi:MAG: hypothetical protein JNL19_09730 [Burkholderiales bacterium]|nr:hypothetical protein [Burkholderiales bacterium]
MNTQTPRRHPVVAPTASVARAASPTPAPHGLRHVRDVIHEHWPDSSGSTLRRPDPEALPPSPAAFTAPLAALFAVLLFVVLCASSAFADGLTTEVVPAPAPALRLYVAEPGECSRVLNPAIVNSSVERQRLASARSDAVRRVSTALDVAASAGGSADIAKLDRLSFVSGPPTLRTDSAGRYILRIGFLASDKAWTRYGEARIRSDAQAALVEVNKQFAESGVPIVFEYAAAERYAGKVDEANLNLSDIYDSVTAPLYYYYGFVEGNYDALLDFRARNAANVAVFMALPVNSGVSGLTDRGLGSFAYSDFTLAIDSGRSESVTTVFANLLTHELGHVLGLRHGVSQDLAPSGLDRDPEEVIKYRLSTNYPYGAGAVVQDDTGAGVASMMTNGWYRTPTQFPATQPTFVKRFSDPTVSVAVIGGDGKTKRFALGVPDQEDSVRALRQDARSFAIASTPMLAAWPVTIVEYFHAGLNQYFMTANTEQIDLLDSLGHDKTGWARTGETMKGVSAWGDIWKISAGGIPTEPRNVIRFYGSPLGPNTHFYTAEVYGYCGHYAPDGKTWLTDTCEEEILRRVEIANAGNPHTLHYEGVDFRTYVTVRGSPGNWINPPVDCSLTDYYYPNEKPMRTVYRLYNGENGTRTRADGSRIDGNHRYTTSMTTADRMVAQGWTFEGPVWCERGFEAR